MKYAAIITAGGGGQRFGMLKQFIPINGVPIFIVTLKKFIASQGFSAIILTAPEDSIEMVKELLKSYRLLTRVKIVSGGDTRQSSIKNGLVALENMNLQIDKVIIHDANRPCIQVESLKKFILTLEHCEILITVCKSINTSCTSNGKIVLKVLDRTSMYEMLMPQGFNFKKLLYAHENTRQSAYTDDLQVYSEKNKVTAGIFEMEYWEGLKLTKQSDYKIFKLLLKKESR
jgi:2-C-methyl-D-erythritol 4-phosphate cytidylyltransferase